MMSAAARDARGVVRTAEEVLLPGPLLLRLRPCIAHRPPHALPSSARHRPQGFQRQADAYERGRPEFPDEAVRFVVDAIAATAARRAADGAPSGSGNPNDAGTDDGGGGGAGVPVAPLSIVDLGAGTGKFTRRLAALADAAITAVEPVPAMRTLCAQLVPTARVLDGTAEHMPLPDGACDGLVAAQAFHWFATDAALREIARVLRPGGLLVLVWNEWQSEQAWVAAARRLLDEHRPPGVPMYRDGTWRDCIERDAARGEASYFLHPMASRAFPYVAHLTPSQVLDRFRSLSFIAAMPPDERERIIQRITALLRTDFPETATAETVDMAYETRVFTLRRRGCARVQPA